MLQGAIPLTTYSNILPFDEVSGRAASHAHAAGGDAFSEPFASPFSRDSRSSRAGSARATRAHASTSRSRTMHADSASGWDRSAMLRSGSASASARTAYSGEGSGRHAKAGAAGSEARSRRKLAASRNGGRFHGEAAWENPSDDYGEPRSAHGGKEKKSGLSAFLSSRRKAKADREFDRRYASRDAAAEDAGPRAALYKGQMGTSHKKSSRMQNRQEHGSASRAAGATAKRPRVARPALLYGLLAAAACLAFAFVVIYPAARDYYVMMRSAAQQQAEYDALTARQDYIQAEVDRLSTDEGIEDEASKELGWVKEGENAAYVDGLDLSEESPVYADVLTGSVPAPDTWYSGFLDPFFGVDPKNVASKS